MIAPLAKRPLYLDVADRVRDLIYQRELRPGDWIDEPELCRQLDISRTPLREALKVLHGENLVELVPRRGCRVRALDDDELLELFPVMASLEGLCAKLAARKLSNADLETLERIHDQLEACAEANDVDSYYEANRTFHLAVQNLAGNRWLQRITGELRNVLILARHRQLTVPGRLQASLEEHRTLMSAFKAGDSEAADKAMYDHLCSQEHILREEKESKQLDLTPT
ncbi:MAG: GntR family transcriptional regulator [Candidatus Thiodiazotropha sp.]|jgi:DNA-binding GntR family transcriptional regulator